MTLVPSGASLGHRHFDNCKGFLMGAGADLASFAQQPFAQAREPKDAIGTCRVNAILGSEFESLSRNR